MIDSRIRNANAVVAPPGNPKHSLRPQFGWLRESGMAVLLLVLVATVFVMPVVVRHETTWRILSDVMLTLLLVSGVAAVANHRKLALVLALFSALVIAFRWAEWVVPIGELAAVRDISILLALLVLSAAIGINVFASDRAVRDRIYGAVVLYLLIGLTFAAVYQMIEASAGGTFTGIGAAGSGISDWVYFSFVTLTTVGFGDITPVSRLARSLSILEALVGQLYPAVIIARLISLPSKTP